MARTKKPISISAIGGICLLCATHAQAAVVLNEVFASGPGSDSEFVEIYNSGPSSVDIEGYFFVDYEAEPDAAGYPGVNNAFEIPAGPSTLLAPGDFFLITSFQFESGAGNFGGFVGDVSFGGNNNIENSANVLALLDDVGTPLHTVYMTQGEAGDVPNLGDGVAITADTTVGPDGSFYPAGFKLVGDGNTANAVLLPFGSGPLDVSPGRSNVIPEPTSLILIMAGMMATLSTRSRGSRNYPE